MPTSPSPATPTRRVPGEPTPTPRPEPPTTESARIPARREFKYLLPPERLPELRAALLGLCQRDRHAGPDGTYVIRTLYLDTPHLQLFQANEREEPVRYKARVRCYPDDPRSPVFAEIKGRHVDVIRKSRAVLPSEGWQDLVQGRGAHDHSRALDDFVYRLHTRTLEPKVLVQYRREAWASTLDPYARVSVDTEIVCQAPAGWSFEATRNWRPIDHAVRTWTARSPSVLELKWADAAPRWMLQLVQRMDLLRHAFSKYCYSMYELAEDHLRGYHKPTGVV